MTVLFYSHPAGLAHDPGPGHPEAPVRLRTILDAVDDAALPWLERRTAPEATRQQVERAHPALHVDRIMDAIPGEGWVRLDADTVVCPASGDAALRAAGAVCAAVAAVAAGETDRAFCAMRPPGHHAEPTTAMGFCLFDSIAIGALHARAVHGLSRLAVVDFDVHHGNGSQAIFWDDPDTLYASTHQWPLYPGTGRADDRGVKGNILNRPLPPGSDGALARAIYEREILPAIDRFRPDLILISAGFDAHAADPLAGLAWEEEDFAWITRGLIEVARARAHGRVVSVLEGGYDPPALARSTLAHLRALAEI